MMKFHLEASAMKRLSKELSIGPAGHFHHRLIDKIGLGAKIAIALRHEPEHLALAGLAYIALAICIGRVGDRQSRRVPLHSLRNFRAATSSAWQAAASSPSSALRARVNEANASRMDTPSPKALSAAAMDAGVG
jgi:hypothetical protein